MTEHCRNVYRDVTKAVKERFDAEEISIPFPQRDVHLYTDQPALSVGLSEKGRTS